MTARISLAGFVGAGLLAGCSTVSSEHIGLGEELDTGRLAPFCDQVEEPTLTTCEQRTQIAQRARAGLTYFLPRQLARVTATRTGGPLDDAVKAVVKAQSEIEATEALIASTKAAVGVTEQMLVDKDLKDAARPILNARLFEQKAALDVAEKALPVKKTAFDAAKTALQTRAATPISTTDKAFKVALKVELLPPSADPAQAYLLSPHHSAFRDDEHKLIVSPAGLLTSTDIVATDRTADILVEVATFAGAIAGKAVGRDGRTTDDADKKCDQSADEYTGTVDFADHGSVQILNKDLQCLGVRMQASGQYWPGSTRPVPGSRKTEAGIEGIVYRTPVQVQVRVEKCLDSQGNCSPDNPKWFPTEVVALSLPQAGPIAFVRQDAGFMTKTKYKLAFSDGVLTSYDASRPSEVLEVARTPMRTLNGFFDGLSKVISLRTGQNNAEAALTTSDLAALQAQFALQNGQIVGQTGLTNAQLALLQSQFALQSGQIVGETGLTNQQLARLQAQYALQGGALVGQTGLTNQQLALLQAQYGLQGGTLVGQTGLTNQQLALLQAQGGLAIGQNNLAVQQWASNLALAIAQLRDQNRQQTLNRCVAEKLDAGQTDISACLNGL
jgi:hypothetical protein